MKFYVNVLGSYDCTFVGPFSTHEAAEAWASNEKPGKPQFDFYPMSENDMRANIAEFGECAIQEP
jgi:hypothetical protein